MVDYVEKEPYKKEEKIQSTERCIRFWESMLFHDKALMSITTAVFIEDTIYHLKKGE